MSLVTLFGSGFDVAAAHRRMAALMEAEGLPYAPRPRTMTYNSRLAQELAAWAVELPGGARIHDALFHAYFVDGVNLAEAEVLTDIAARAGLDPAATGEVVEQRTHKSVVDQDWERSRRLGVTGVPTFVMNGRAVVGARPYEMLEKLVVTAGARRREVPGEPR
jgi:predicted DsbA family dithiol-disulfide isomerase